LRPRAVDVGHGHDAAQLGKALVRPDVRAADRSGSHNSYADGRRARHFRSVALLLHSRSPSLITHAPPACGALRAPLPHRMGCRGDAKTPSLRAFATKQVKENLNRGQT